MEANSHILSYLGSQVLILQSDRLGIPDTKNENKYGVHIMFTKKIHRELRIVPTHAIIQEYLRKKGYNFGVF